MRTPTHRDGIADTLFGASEGADTAPRLTSARAFSTGRAVCDRRSLALSINAEVLRALVPVIAVFRALTDQDALASKAPALSPARCSILDCREAAPIRWVTGVFGARVAVVTHGGREVAGTIRIVAAVLCALVVVVAVLGAVALRHSAVSAAVLRARTAEQVFKALDGAWILFVGCEVARRHA